MNIAELLLTNPRCTGSKYLKWPRDKWKFDFGTPFAILYIWARAGHVVKDLFFEVTNEF